MVVINRTRGEVEAVIDGKPYRLCLTLNALAELESRLNEPDLLALVKRLTGGQLSTAEIIAIIGAGLRGGGTPVEDKEVGMMHIDGGLNGLVDLVADLLNATFQVPAESSAAESATEMTAAQPNREPQGMDTGRTPTPGKWNRIPTAL